MDEKSRPQLQRHYLKKHTVTRLIKEKARNQREIFIRNKRYIQGVNAAAAGTRFSF